MISMRPVAFVYTSAGFRYGLYFGSGGAAARIIFSFFNRSYVTGGSIILMRGYSVCRRISMYSGPVMVK